MTFNLGSNIEDASEGFMNKTFKKPTQYIICSVALSTLTACGWVDSTGTQATEFTTNEELRIAQAIAVNEQTTVIADLVGEGSNLTGWTWLEGDTDVRQQCTSLNGFDNDYAQAALTNACTNNDECSIEIKELSTETGTQFSIKMPTLKAPIALSYTFSTSHGDGTIVNREQVFCGISINEAPIAKNDSYTIRLNSAKIVYADDSDNLLSNDSDDDDVRNNELSVLATPVTAPLYASQFSITSDGGFSYQPSPDVTFNDAGFIEDTFTYAVTDGLHTAEAQVNIKIIDTNEPPQQITQLPDVVLVASNNEDNSHLRSLDLARYFSDPDGDELSFTSDDFTSASSIALSSTGILSSDATLDDVGQKRILLNADDGKESVNGMFVLTVRIPASLKDLDANHSPTVTDISNRSFSDQFSYDVSVFFNDADAQDQLTFIAHSLPAGLQIRADGVIEGEVDSSNMGQWFVSVTADDGYGGIISDGFRLTLN